MLKRSVFLLILCMTMVVIPIQIYASDKIFINDNFESASTSNWTDNTGRGVKTVESESGNKYMALMSNGTSYYNFQAEHIYSTGLLYCEFDIKFTSGNMEIQLRESRDTSAAGFTMAGRLRKTAYYLEYFSNGSYYKMTNVNNSGQWYELYDTSKWYTIKMSLDVRSNTYSVYLLDRRTKSVISKVENIAFYGQCNYINYFAFSSTDKLCIDNVNIREMDIEKLRVTGEPYPTIPSYGRKTYTYYANAITGSVETIVGDVIWSIKTPKSGVSINTDTGVLTVEASAEPGPVLIETALKYQPTLKTAYLVDLEK